MFGGFFLFASVIFRRFVCVFIALLPLTMVIAQPSFYLKQHRLQSTACVINHSLSFRSLPSFNYQQGWLGGDAAYSVYLGKGRTLWLFGDTFVNRTSKQPHSRKNTVKIPNSIAISDHSAVLEKPQMHFFWRSKDGIPQPVFSYHQPAHTVLWPKSGFVVNHTLYVVLTAIKFPAGGYFYEQASLLASIKNYLQPPAQWRIHYQSLATGSLAYPGVATVIKKPYIIWFTVLSSRQTKLRPIILTRLAIKDLSHPQHNIAYLSQNNHWVYDQQWRHAKIIMPNAATEMSVHFNGISHQWQAIYSADSKTIQMSQAKHLTGPWQKPQVLYHFPEIINPILNAKHTVFCYAAKAHLHMNGIQPNQLAITYVCNSNSLTQLMNNLSLYKPRWVVVTCG